MFAGDVTDRHPAAPSRSATGMAIGLALALGAASALWPSGTLAGLLLPLLLLLAVRFPETLLVLFLTAGIYKEDPRLVAVLPFDVTIAVGALLALVLVVRFFRRPVTIPNAVWLLAPLVVMMALGVVRPATAYGAEKALRFCTLTLLALTAGILLLDDRKAMNRFLVGLAVLGLVASLDAINGQESTEWGRLTANGSSPIALGRIGALAFAFGWLRFHFARSLFDKLVAAGVVLATALCVLASGSRGPVLGVVASMLTVSAITALRHRRSPIALGPIVFLGGLGVLALPFATTLTLPLHRFELLVSENKGSSILARGFLYATAWHQTLTHPLGLGVGGFERVSILDLRYPHNLLLEVGSELGWVPLGALIILIVWSLRTLLSMLRREYSWACLFLAIVVLTSLANSMVSGDLNDNRLVFAVLLLPFAYAQLQKLESPGASGEGPRADARGDTRWGDTPGSPFRGSL